MGRMNARNPPSRPDELTKWTVKICEKSDYKAVIQIISNFTPQRDIEIASGLSYQLAEPSKKMASIAQIYGQVMTDPCANCAEKKGPFLECVVFEGQMRGKCAGCYYSQCDCSIADARTRSLRQRNLQTPTKRKHSNGSAQSYIASSALVPNGPKRPKICATSISSGVPGSNQDILICGSFYLPNPRYCSLPQAWVELIRCFEPAFHARNTRDLNEFQMRKPIQNLQLAFEQFKIQEQRIQEEQNHQRKSHPNASFVRPSGDLSSPLTHLLHQPSTTTLYSGDDAETADYSNGCLRQIMNNAYTDGTFVFDWLHRRHEKSRGLEEYSEEILSIHEQFSMDILESLDSKVILIYGKRVQERILNHTKLRVVCLPCWGLYEGVVIQIFLEEGFRNADCSHKIRFYGLFLTHPQRQFYEKEDSAAARLQDKMTEIAVRMTSNTIPYKHDYYAKRRWMSENVSGKELYILNQHKNNLEKDLEQWSSFQEKKAIDQSSLTHPVLESEKHAFFCSTPHDIKTLQELLPRAIRAANCSGTTWKTLEHLPEEVHLWLKGVKQSVFPTINMLDVQNVQEIHRALCQNQWDPESGALTTLSSKSDLREYLLQIMHAQQEQVSKFKGPLIHLYYVRLDRYVVELRCRTCCAPLKDDTEARWAINRPDHYWMRRPHCYSQNCQGKRTEAIPVDESLRERCFNAEKTAHQNLLYTEPQVITTHYDRDKLVRTSSESEKQRVESLCIRCGGDTQLKSGSNLYIDDRPRWTIGANPKYFERRPVCTRCVSLGRASGRFVPKDPSIMSVDKKWLNEVARICWSYSPEMREFLVPNFPPCRRDYRYDKRTQLQ